MDPITSTPTTAEKKKVGPIVATLIIVLILIITALYVFAAKLNTQADLPTDTAMTTEETTVTVAPVTNTSDSLEDIQKDLENSNF